MLRKMVSILWQALELFDNLLLLGLRFEATGDQSQLLFWFIDGVYFDLMSQGRQELPVDCEAEPAGVWLHREAVIRVMNDHQIRYAIGRACSNWAFGGLTGINLPPFPEHQIIVTSGCQLLNSSSRNWPKRSAEMPLSKNKKTKLSILHLPNPPKKLLHSLRTICSLSPRRLSLEP